MTIEERIERNRQASQSVMKYALPLGLWFIIEYITLIASAHNLMFSMLRVPMIAITLILLFYFVHKLRGKYYSTGFRGRQGWYFTMQLMFYSGLIEAIFIFVLNKWIMPGNLGEMQASLLAQYEEVSQALKESNSIPALTSIYEQTMQTLRETPVETPINAAIGQLSNNVLIGMLLGIPYGLILRRKEESPHQERETINQENDKEEE